MVRRNSGVILRQLHALLEVGTFGGLSDRQLLDRFLARYDEASELAFTILVERHGPMVLGVCRRILVDPHDAEDAFQATFLVLVRKAGSVRIDGSIGRWLFGVATRVAMRARADARRRRGRERAGAERLEAGNVVESTPTIERGDLQSILTEEIARLPARLQLAVSVCDLEGCSYDQAAHRLGWPVGTVKSRLSRARGLLRQRLTRRGLAPDDFSTSIPMLATSLSRGLVETTIKSVHSPIAGRLTTIGVVSTSVATLTEGVLRTMYWTKIKPAIFATLLIIGGSAFVFSQATGQKPAGPGTTVPPTIKAEKPGNLRRLTGESTVKDEGKRVEPSRRNNPLVERVIGKLVMPVVSEALIRCRHVLDFQGALDVTLLMGNCECALDAAIRKLAPSAEAAESMKDLRGPINVIGTAIQGEKRALEKSRAANVLLLSVATVIRRLEQGGGDAVPDTQSYYLLCDDPPKDEGGRGIGVTMVWDFPKGAIALDKLEATVWIQFLVFPNGPKTGQNGTRTWNVESRKLRFTLKGEDWIKE